MKSSHFVLPFLLILTLLFAQTGGLTHGIAHTLAEQAQDQSLPHDKHCDLCATYAQVGSALSSGDIRFDFALPMGAALYTVLFSYRSLSFTAFAARAPPHFA